MAQTDPLTRELDRERLDGQINQLSRAARKGAFQRPRTGWVRAIRDAIGMNGRQLADRLGIARSHLSHIERAELSESTTLKTMVRAAEALDCVFVYAFIPRKGESLEAVIRERAQGVATEIVERVGTSMALEAQGVDDRAFQKKEIDRVASEIVRTKSKVLWDR